MIRPITFSVSSKTSLKRDAKVAAANAVLRDAGMSPLTSKQAAELDRGPKFWQNELFSWSATQDIAMTLLFHGFFDNGFSEAPVRAYRKNYRNNPFELLRSFRLATEVQMGHGGPCKRRVAYSDGFADCSAVLLKPDALPIHLFHCLPSSMARGWRLYGSGSELLASFPKGKFIDILGTESEPIENDAFQDLGHERVRTIHIPTGPHSWSVGYKKSTDRIIASVAGRVCEFKGFNP